MLYFVIIVVIALAVVFTAANVYYRKRDRERARKEEKSPFRTEADLEEYGKPMKNGEYPPTVNFDDAE